MIVIGTDTHKKSHTAAAVFAGTGELTAPARKVGFGELLAWGRDLDAGRIWAIEDCRHGARAEDQQRLRWHLHDLWPDFELPAGCLNRVVWLDRVARKLARAEQSARVRVSRELVRAIRDRTKHASELEREVATMARAQAPQLLELPGCGPLTAAKLLAEMAGVARFASDAKLAHLAGVAPIPASYGNRTRLRLDRGGNRQLNCAVHRIAVTQSRVHAPAQEFLARKRAEGKSTREALRSLKRHLIRRVWRLLIDSERERSVKTVDTQRGLPGAAICGSGLT